MEEVKNSNNKKIGELSDDKRAFTIKIKDAITIIESENGSSLKYKNL